MSSSCRPFIWTRYGPKNIFNWGSLFSNKALPNLKQYNENIFLFILLQKEHKYYLKKPTALKNAYHIFVAVHCEKCPAQAPCLINCMATVQKLSNDVGEKAAFTITNTSAFGEVKSQPNCPGEK